MPRSSSDIDIRDQHGTLMAMARPFDEDDLTSFPEERLTESLHRRSQRRPEVPLRDPRTSDQNLLLREAKQRDVSEAMRYMVPEVGPDQPQRRSLLGRVQPAQFGTVPGLGEAHEQMRENPLGLTRVPKSSRIMDRPAQYVTQANWQKGMGDSWTERHFSPRARAQGHLAAGVAMFLAASPPLAERPNVTRIRY